MDFDQKQPLADDPDFLARLDDLDAGLLESAGASAAEQRALRRHEVHQQQPQKQPQEQFRQSDASLIDIDDSLEGFFESSPASPHQPVPMDEPRSSFLPVAETLTYETFYGLTEKPFSLSTDPRFLYHSATHDRAAQELLSAIRRREGFVILTGEAGTGKTTLCRAVVDQLDRRTLTSFVFDPFSSFDDLLKTVLVDFGVVAREDLAHGQLRHASRHDLMAALRDFFLSLAPLQAFAVVVIDQAQDVPASALEQVRLLSDLEGDARLLQVVLVGQPRLLTMLRHGELKQLDQRISVRCSLEPIAEDDMRGYVTHRISTAGANSRVDFDDEALRKVHLLARGVPRVVNLLCDRALSFGYESSAGVIDETAVESAADVLDLGVPESGAFAMARMAAAVVSLAFLMLLGAGAAALVFNDQFTEVLHAWQKPAAASSTVQPNR